MPSPTKITATAIFPSFVRSLTAQQAAAVAKAEAVRKTPVAERSEKQLNAVGLTRANDYGTLQKIAKPVKPVVNAVTIRNTNKALVQAAVANENDETAANLSRSLASQEASAAAAKTPAAPTIQPQHIAIGGAIGLLLLFL